MRRFIIHTRGRTGSSAIAEELNNHSEIVCHGEAFRPDPLSVPAARKAYAEFGNDYPAKGRTADRILPFKLFTGDAPDAPVTEQGFGAYFDFLEQSAGDAAAVGAKVLANHVPLNVLPGFCRKYDVSVLQLRRRNVLRQAISGQVAQAVGVYNSRNFQPEEGRSFALDPSLTIKRMQNYLETYAKHGRIWRDAGVATHVIYYEDWLDNRGAFFEGICDFLGVPMQLPAQTTFRQMTPEPLHQLLDNYQEMADALSRRGFEQYLEA